jgi:hypothetical protein
MNPEIETMGKYKEYPKYNVISIRVSDEERIALNEMMQNSRKSISSLLREAIQLYSPSLKMLPGN